MLSVTLLDIPVNEEAGHCVAAPAATSQSVVEPLQPKPRFEDQCIIISLVSIENLRDCIPPLSA